MANLKFTPKKNVLSITGHQTVAALDKHIKSWNPRYPEHQILCRQGCVEENSLLAALEHEAALRTPGYQPAKMPGFAQQAVQG